MKEVQSVRLHAKGDSDRYENLLDSENTQEVNCIMKGSMRWKLLVFSSLLWQIQVTCLFKQENMKGRYLI